MDVIDYIPGNLEKIASALDRIADAVESWVKLEQQRYENEYPARNPAPATVAVAEYNKPDDRAPEEQGPVFPEDVAGIGPREKALLAKNRETQSRRQRS